MSRKIIRDDDGKRVFDFVRDKGKAYFEIKNNKKTHTISTESVYKQMGGR